MIWCVYLIGSGAVRTGHSRRFQVPTDVLDASLLECIDYVFLLYLVRAVFIPGVRRHGLFFQRGSSVGRTRHYSQNLVG